MIKQIIIHNSNDVLYLNANIAMLIITIVLNCIYIIINNNNILLSIGFISKTSTTI